MTRSNAIGLSNQLMPFIISDFRRSYLFLSLLLVSLWASCARVDTVMIRSEAMDKDIPNIVVLPETYQPEGKSYPVLYLLHGATADYTSWLNKSPELPALVDRYDFIIVCPDGGYTSWYIDSPIDPKMKYETYVASELISAIDDQFNTIKKREGRAVSGLSMGGHGALYLAFRNQEVWGAAGSTSGGLDFRPFPDSWDLARRLGAYSKEKSNWEKNTVINMIDRIEDGDFKLIIDCGTDDFFFDGNREMHQRLLDRKIQHDYTERPGGHTNEYWANSIKHHLLFFSEFFQESNPNLISTRSAVTQWDKKKYGEKVTDLLDPDWGFYTRKGRTLYAHILNLPKDKSLEIDQSVQVIKAQLVGHSETDLIIDNNTIMMPNKPEGNGLPLVVELFVIPNEDWPNLKKYQVDNQSLDDRDKEARVVFMGNSITEKWKIYDPKFFEDNPFICRGISGQTTGQMLLRFRQDVIELHPKVVVIHAGTNDIAANNGPVTLDQLAGNIFSMAELAKSHNISVIIASVLPATSYSWRPGIQPADKIIALNKLLKAYSDQNGFTYLDYYSKMVNKNNGLMESYGRDTVHPSLEGYKVMESLVKPVIDEAIRLKK